MRRGRTDRRRSPVADDDPCRRDLPAGTTRDGATAMVDYTAGAFVLADDAGRVIVGPVQIEAAQALAEAVACGNPRALTEPQNSLILATALIALCQLWPRGKVPKAEATE